MEEFPIFNHQVTDAFNPNTGWVNPDVIGINLGITLFERLEPTRRQRLGRFMRNREIPRAMEMVGLRHVAARAPQRHPSLTSAPAAATTVVEPTP